MFSANGKAYTVRYNENKFKELDFRIVAELLSELFHSVPVTGEMSDKALKLLFVIGLEEEKNGKRVPFKEGEEHFKRLIQKNSKERIQGLKKFISEKFYNEMPKFFSYLENMNR